MQRALQLIQRGEPVTRGTLQTVFNYTPYDELVRLGLQAATQEAARKARPDLTGMLVVDEVLPGSPTEGKLQPGDILTHVNGQLVTTFQPLEEILDDSVGGKVDIVVERGGEKVQQTLPVGDLHAITPSEFLEFGDAVVHTLSYQMARHFNAPVRGVYVANPGYVLNAAGVPRGAVISSVNGKPVADHGGIPRHRRRAAARRARGAALLHARRPEGFRDARDAHGPRAGSRRRSAVATTGPACGRARNWRRAPLRQAVQPARTDFRCRQRTSARTRLAASLVLVTFDMPFSVAGITERNYHGTGVIVDAERGLVVVDRNTVPVAPGDVRLTFGGVDRGARQGRVRASAAQPGGGVVRPGGARRHADPRREVRPARARAGRAGDGRRPRRRFAAAVARDVRRDDGRRAISRCRARCSSATPTSRSSRW